MQINIQVFENQAFGKVRMVEKDGEPWWVLKDVCGILGIENPSYVRTRLDDDEVGSFDLPHPQNPAKCLRMTCVSESGLYAVILRSDKPNARAFRRWITAEVLPSIRKHGAYITADILKQMQESTDFAEELFECLVVEYVKAGVLMGCVDALQPKAQYFDAVLQSPHALSVSVIAKDYGMSAFAFNKLLHELGVQYKIGGTWLLYKEYANCGYTVSKTYLVGDEEISVHTCWTQLGRLFLYELLKWYGIRPEAERVAESAAG